MSDSTKDWANIRIEEPVRDDARDDPRTYTEIMRAGLGADATPAAEPTFAEADIRNAMRDVLSDGIDPATLNDALMADAGDLPPEVRDQLDRIESAAKEATNAAQSAEKSVEGLQR